MVNDASGPEDYVLTASGGMPGELHGGWRTGIVKQEGSATSGATMDLEYGFSCMGYEVVAPWGAAMARAQTHPGGLVTGLFGDGSYLMLNLSYSAAFSGVPFVAVLCDNSGYAVIHRLQTNQGAEGFNNMLADSRGPGADGSVHVDFPAHARSLGCLVEDVPASAGVEGLQAAYDRAGVAAREASRPAVVVCRTHYSTWTEAGAWWETGVPESLSGRESYDDAKQQQPDGCDGSCQTWRVPGLTSGCTGRPAWRATPKPPQREAQPRARRSPGDNCCQNRSRHPSLDVTSRTFTTMFGSAEIGAQATFLTRLLGRSDAAPGQPQTTRNNSNSTRRGSRGAVRLQLMRSSDRRTIFR